MEKLLISFLLLLPAVASASLRLPLPWPAVGKVSYYSRTVQEKTQGKDQQRTQTRETSVVATTAIPGGGFLQVWRSQAPDIRITGNGTGIAAEQRTARELAARFASIPLEVELAADGSYRGIRNWDRIGKTLREVMLPALVANARQRPELAKVDQATLLARLQPVLERLTSQAAIDRSIGKQPALFNFFTGAELERGKPRAYEDTQASPWSADLIPTAGAVELVGEDPKAGTVTVRWRQGIDPKKGADVAWKLVQAIEGGKTTKAHPPGLPSQLQLADSATVVIERATGLPVRIEHRREVGFGGNRNITTWTLSRSDD